MLGLATCGGLFSGIGGFCRGFESAGFVTRWAVDIDREACSTYQLNHPSTQILNRDIRTLGASELLPVDVLHAGFPCQSFSVAGNRRGFADPRGALFFEITRLLKEWGEAKPKVILLENSPGLKIGEHGSWFDRVRIDLQKAGYWFNDMNCQILCTRLHGGLPQRRERLFLIATNRDHFNHNPFTKTTFECPRLGLRELLDIGLVEDDRYFLPEDTRYGALIAEACRELGPNQLVQLRKHVLRPQPPDSCPTLTANMGLGGHNVPFLLDNGRLRKLTEWECLRLQGFPSDFYWSTPALGSRYRMIGNSVSPRISQTLANNILQFLSEESNDYGLEVPS